MAIEYAKSALSESIIPVKDYELGTFASTPKSGDLVRLSAGKIEPVALAPTATFGVVTSNANLGVLEGTNFEGLEQARKVGKIRISGSAVYRGEYGTSDATTGVFTKSEINKNIIGTEKALTKGLNGFSVDATNTTAANLTVKIVDVDVKRGYVYFQFKASAIVSS
jgi:hypothetical protein